MSILSGGYSRFATLDSLTYEYSLFMVQSPSPQVFSHDSPATSRSSQPNWSHHLRGLNHQAPFGTVPFGSCDLGGAGAGHLKTYLDPRGPTYI